jgi:antitoxin (DNA-binding transcriptional repressor) of toxin-antitoxin stability system
MRLMKVVGVKQLKARLSEYLRLVKTGEIVLITDREDVVAELRPARRQSASGLSVEEQLQALADAGEITRPSLPKGAWTWKPKGLGLPAGTAARLLDEVRGDRV